MREQVYIQPARWWIIGLGIVILATAGDLLLDFATGVHVVHIVIESVVLVVMASISVAMWKRRGQRIIHLDNEVKLLDFEVKLLDTKVKTLDAEIVRWRDENRELMSGLGVAIEEQFARWRLTQAESEVGVLLLKGLSLKEVAEVRQTSERTARDQARAIYRKSDLSGRSELSAFFLEDLLLPSSAA